MKLIFTAFVSYRYRQSFCFEGLLRGFPDGKRTPCAQRFPFSVRVRPRPLLNTCPTFPLNSEIDNVTNYVSAVPLKELGLGLGVEHVGDEQAQELTDDYSLPALKVSSTSGAEGEGLGGRHPRVDGWVDVVCLFLPVHLTRRPGCQESSKNNVNVLQTKDNMNKKIVQCSRSKMKRCGLCASCAGWDT